MKTIFGFLLFLGGFFGLFFFGLYFFLNCIWADSLNTELQPVRQKYQLTEVPAVLLPVAVMILIKEYCDEKRDSGLPAFGIS